MKNIFKSMLIMAKSLFAQQRVEVKKEMTQVFTPEPPKKIRGSSRTRSAYRFTHKQYKKRKAKIRQQKESRRINRKSA